MKFENILKGIITTVLGAVAIGAAGYGWWVEHLTDWQAGGLATIGTAFLLMKDQIPGFVSSFFNVLLDKFKGGK